MIWVINKNLEDDTDSVKTSRSFWPKYSKMLIYILSFENLSEMQVYNNDI